MRRQQQSNVLHRGSSARSGQAFEQPHAGTGEPGAASDEELQQLLSAPAGEPGHDVHEASLFENFFSWPPPPAEPEEPLPVPEPTPMTPQSKRAMWSSLAMFAVSFCAIVCYWGYNHFVMPAPAELTDPDAFDLPTPVDGPATEVLGSPARRTGPSLGPRLETRVSAATAESVEGAADAVAEGAAGAVVEGTAGAVAEGAASAVGAVVEGTAGAVSDRSAAPEHGSAVERSAAVVEQGAREHAADRVEPDSAAVQRPASIAPHADGEPTAEEASEQEQHEAAVVPTPGARADGVPAAEATAADPTQQPTGAPETGRAPPQPPAAE